MIVAVCGVWYLYYVYGQIPVRWLWKYSPMTFAFALLFGEDNAGIFSKMFWASFGLALLAGGGEMLQPAFSLLFYHPGKTNE